MQVISGTFRGKKLCLPDIARPTSMRAKQALYSMINGLIELPVNTVWDAFAGSGAFGVEFISRSWSQHIVFTDISKNSIDCIRRNISSISGNKMATILHTDALSAVSKFGDSDIIFIDPPYSQYDIIDPFLKKLTSKITPESLLVLEIEVTQPIPKTIEAGYEILRDRTYGRARFLILKQRNIK